MLLLLLWRFRGWFFLGEEGLGNVDNVLRGYVIMNESLFKVVGIFRCEIMNIVMGSSF